MKKLFSLMAMAMLVISVMPFVLGVDVGTGIGIDITPEEFPPHIWMCDNRVVVDDQVEDGRVDGVTVIAQKVELCDPNNPALDTTEEWCAAQCAQFNDPTCVQTCLDADRDADKKLGDAEHCPILKGLTLDERHENYAFEGEKIEWKVLVMDKNKIEQIQEVVATIGDVQGEGNDIEVECVRLNNFASNGDDLLPECNARILEEELDVFDDQTMAYYECTFTVETPDSMYGEFWVTVEAIGTDGESATMDENEFWFLNPVIALSVDGDLEFEDVRPGSISYSDTLLVGNDADEGSGVLLDMFISGTDFYDSSSSDARCVITNRLKLGDNVVSSTNNKKSGAPASKCQIGFTDGNDHLCYFATNGAYSTQPLDGDIRSDVEGYAPIVYGDTFTEDFYNDAEIIWNKVGLPGGYSAGNVLSPGAEISLTFKLGLPEPCIGNFDSGDIFFWGEAI